MTDAAAELDRPGRRVLGRARSPPARWRRRRPASASTTTASTTSRPAAIAAERTRLERVAAASRRHPRGRAVGGRARHPVDPHRDELLRGVSPHPPARGLDDRPDERLAGPGPRHPLVPDRRDAGPGEGDGGPLAAHRAAPRRLRREPAARPRRRSSRRRHPGPAGDRHRRRRGRRERRRECPPRAAADAPRRLVRGRAGSLPRWADERRRTTPSVRPSSASTRSSPTRSPPGSAPTTSRVSAVCRAGRRPTGRSSATTRRSTGARRSCTRIGLAEVARIDAEMERLGASVLGATDRDDTARRLRTDPAMHFASGGGGRGGCAGRARPGERGGAGVVRPPAGHPVRGRPDAGPRGGALVGRLLPPGGPRWLPAGPVLHQHEPSRDPAALRVALPRLPRVGARPPPPDRHRPGADGAARLPSPSRSDRVLRGLGPLHRAAGRPDGPVRDRHRPIGDALDGRLAGLPPRRRHGDARVRLDPAAGDRLHDRQHRARREQHRQRGRSLHRLAGPGPRLQGRPARDARPSRRGRAAARRSVRHPGLPRRGPRQRGDPAAHRCGRWSRPRRPIGRSATTLAPRPR